MRLQNNDLKCGLPVGGGGVRLEDQAAVARHTHGKQCDHMLE